MADQYISLQTPTLTMTFSGKESRGLRDAFPCSGVEHAVTLDLLTITWTVIYGKQQPVELVTDSGRHYVWDKHHWIPFEVLRRRWRAAMRKRRNRG